ncbi:hypothetical protein [Sorangium sp. So ce1024]|uniref:hypothetical protein n=1 Tax=Sorangium sp. So ce1024 TaxID=3133327 RepID=UPI003F01583E
MDEKKVIARFQPQAWINNYAVDVDPEGAVEFDVTADIERMGRDEALALKDNSDDSDMLAKSASAPEWIRSWTGPFYVNVQQSVRSYFGQVA